MTFDAGPSPYAYDPTRVVKDRIRDRLVQLSARLADADWLDGGFSAGGSSPRNWRSTPLLKLPDEIRP